MKETKTVQVYPDDAIVNNTISEYGSFGWEVVSNQRCQEFEGSTHDVITGSTTKHYSTFNKITFSREKSEVWYDEVVKTEREYNSVNGTISSYKNKKPVLKKPKPKDDSVAFSIGFSLYLWLIPGIIYSIVRGALKSKYKKRYRKELAAYENEYSPKIEELGKQAEALRARAEACISGKA